MNKDPYKAERIKFGEPEHPENEFTSGEKMLLWLIAAVVLASVAYIVYGLLRPPCPQGSAQERAGYGIVLQAQRAHLEAAVARLTEARIVAEVRSIREHAELVKLQQEYGRVLGAQVVIPEPTPILVSQLDAREPTTPAPILPITKALWERWGAVAQGMVRKP